MVLCSSKAIASSESWCHMNEIQKKKKSIFPVVSLPQIAVRNCLDISFCLLSYFSPFLYLSITKYAGDWIAKIIFISGFILKERGIR